MRNFHDGEVRLQVEFGVDVEALERGVTRPFQPELSDNEVRFVQGLTFGVAASVDADGKPWASPLFGRAGQLFTVEDQVSVGIAPPSTAGDPLVANVNATGHLGVLYFDPSRRRRAKSIGTGAVRSHGSIGYRMHRNFGLCTKYIYKRNHEPADGPANRVSAPFERRTELNDEDRAMLAAADTAFLASFHVDNGADATHRGGPAGFITAVDATTVAMPDYLGNGMFNTLGNLLIDDRVGLLVIDYDSGRTLQLTGTGTARPSAPEDEMSTRTLFIDIAEIIVTRPTIGRWTDVEPADYSPGQRNPATPFLQTD